MIAPTAAPTLLERNYSNRYGGGGSYQNNTNLNSTIRYLLNIDKAEQHTRKIRELLHEKLALSRIDVGF